MIEPAKNSELIFLENRFHIDQYHNPYLAKFTLKVSPSTTVKHNSTLISPFQSTNQLYLSQSLPIFKSEHFRTSLVWKQTLKKRLGRSYIGFSSQYSANNDWNIKSKFLFGRNLLYNLSVNKIWQNNYEGSIFHSGMYDNNINSMSFGIGLKKENFSASINRRVGFNYQAILAYNQRIFKNYSLSATGEVAIDQELKMNNLEPRLFLSLDYPYSQSIKAKIGLNFQLNQEHPGLKVQAQKSLSNWGKFIFNVEYRNNVSIISFGYKNPTLNLILPVAIIDSAVPVALASILYLLGYRSSSNEKKTQTDKIQLKQQSVRRDELNLISDKANINYEREENAGQNGLLIQEAYVGPHQLIEKIKNSKQEQRVVLFNKNVEIKEKVYDIIVCARFYVLKHELKMHKGNKMDLLGFYCKDSSDQIFIKYKKKGEVVERIFKMNDSIEIK